MHRLEFVIRRTAASLFVLLGVSFITFFLARVVPSNAAALYIGPRARPEDIARVAEQLGLNRPLPVQYMVYMRAMLQGDWGISIGTKRPVLQELAQRLPATLELIFTAKRITAQEALETGEKVAIKKVGRIFESPHSAVRVLREILLLSRLRHRNIQRVLDVVLPKKKRISAREILDDYKRIMEWQDEYLEHHRLIQVC
jgi:serine/threonine protein kinase